MEKIKKPVVALIDVKMAIQRINMGIGADKNAKEAIELTATFVTRIGGLGIGEKTIQEGSGSSHLSAPKVRKKGWLYATENVKKGTRERDHFAWVLVRKDIKI